jgi:hypothetical protein
MVIYKQPKFESDVSRTIMDYNNGELSDKAIYDLLIRKKLTSSEMFEISYFIGRNGIVSNKVICLDDLQKGRYPFIEDMKSSLFWVWANLYMIKSERDNQNPQKTIRFVHSQREQFYTNLVYKGQPLQQKHINYLCLNNIRFQLLLGEIDKYSVDENFDFDNIPEEYDFEVKQVDTTGLVSYYAYDKLNKILKFCKKDKGGKDDSKYVNKYLIYVGKMDDGQLKTKLTERLEYKRPPIKTYTYQNTGVPYAGRKINHSWSWEGCYD